MSEGSSTPKPRKRYRSAGVPGSRRTLKHTGFLTHEGKRQTALLHREAAPSRIDELVQHYASQGLPVPLEEAFPEPPPAEPENDIIRRRAALPSVNGTVARSEPSSEYLRDSEGAYREEHQLKLVHTMLLRNATLQQVAGALEVPLSEAFNLRRRLFSRLRAEAGSLDMLTHVGETVATFREHHSMAMRQFDTSQTKADKARFLALAQSAQANVVRFLQVAGLYEDNPYRPAQPEVAKDDDMQVLSAVLQSVFNPDIHEDEMEELLAEKRDGAPGAENVYSVKLI